MTEKEKKDFIFKQDISLLYDMAKYIATACLGYLVYSFMVQKIVFREFGTCMFLLLVSLALVLCRARHTNKSYKCTPEKKESDEKDS